MDDTHQWTAERSDHRREICRQQCPLNAKGVCREHRVHQWALGILVTVGLALGGGMVKTHQTVAVAVEKMADTRNSIATEISTLSRDLAVNASVAKTNTTLLKEVRDELLHRRRPELRRDP